MYSAAHRNYLKLSQRIRQTALYFYFRVQYTNKVTVIALVLGISNLISVLILNFGKFFQCATPNFSIYCKILYWQCIIEVVRYKLESLVAKQEAAGTFGIHKRSICYFGTDVQFQLVALGRYISSFQACPQREGSDLKFRNKGSWSPCFSPCYLFQELSTQQCSQCPHLYPTTMNKNMGQYFCRNDLSKTFKCHN